MPGTLRLVAEHTRVRIQSWEKRVFLMGDDSMIGKFYVCQSVSSPSFPYNFTRSRLVKKSASTSEGCKKTQRKASIRERVWCGLF